MHHAAPTLQQTRRRRRARTATAVVVGTLFAGASALPATAATVDPLGPTEHTTLDLTGEDVMEHLTALETIANAFAEDGYRVWNGPGYDASALYVETVLEATGAFTVERQSFEVASEVTGPITFTVDGEPVTETAHLSSAEGTTSPIVDAPIALPAATDGVNIGCAAEDYAEIPADSIVLVERGSCTFQTKVLLASAAEAAAVLIFNNAEGLFNGTVGERTPDSAPAASLSQASGVALRDAVAAAAAAGDPVPTGSLTIEKSFETATTYNIIAETTAGDPEDVLVIGAHLDGVAEGPGVNDNGTGTAAVLALAERIAAAETPNDSRIRLGFWGAEEIGLLGSAHYVSDLLLNDPAELDRISAYLNYDMLGSENYTVGVYDADQSTFVAPQPVPDGSIELESIYTDYFDSVEQPWVDSEFSGRSDYQAFILAGIPAGGLFSGADSIKTEEEAAIFGGVANQALDRNYHTAEDTVANVSQEAIGIFAPAIGFAAHSLAWELVEPPVEPEPEPEPQPQPPAPEQPTPEQPAPETPGKDYGAVAPDKAGSTRLAETGSDLLLPLAVGTALLLLLTGGATAAVAATRARRAR